MAGEPQALAIRPEAAEEDDYRSLCAALEASARGRAFLAEHARRNRNADTELVLGALDRLAAQMRADAAAITDLRGELRMLLTAIRLARPDIDAGRPPGKVAMLTALVDLLERRIDAIVEDKAAAQAVADEDDEVVRPQLAVVPPPEEPELPIPSPFVAQPPAIAVVSDAAAARRAVSAAIMPEVNVLDGAPTAARVVVKPATRPASKSAAPAVEAPPADPLRPLAAIMALSEEERIALFS
jgi:hypothetical protein